MSILGTVLKNRRAGEAGLAWNLPGHYVFQLFALGAPATDDAQAARANPRALLDAVHAPVLARARLTGSFER